MSFIIFYLLLLLILGCSLLVILSKNPIQSVLFLILVFLLSSLLFLVIGAEFLAILLLTVYVGAISILFLFVVMMLDVRRVEALGSIYYHLPITGFVGVFFLAIWFVAIYTDLGTFKLSWFSDQVLYKVWLDSTFFYSNLHLVGEVFYNHYVSLFILAALVLLIAMVGVIVLTIDFEYHRQYIKKPIPNLDRQSSGLVVLTKLYKFPWRKVNYNLNWFSANNLWPYSANLPEYIPTYWNFDKDDQIDFESYVENKYGKYKLFRKVWSWIYKDQQHKPDFSKYQKKN